MAASVMTFAQKNHETDTIRAPLAYVYNIDKLLITLKVDSVKFKVQLGGKPKDEIPAWGELDLRPGDTLTLCGVRNPRKNSGRKIRICYRPGFSLWPMLTITTSSLAISSPWSRNPLSWAGT